jgi:hypothetical protein
VPTAPTRQRQQTPQRRIDPDPVHPSMRKYRTILTVTPLIGLAGSVVWLAVSLGTNNRGHLVAAITGIIVGVTGASLAQVSGIYQWLYSRGRPDGDVQPEPDPEPTGGRVPRQRTPAPGPARPQRQRPAPDLGPDFAYIIDAVRQLVASEATDRINIMEAYWAAAGWPDTDDDPRWDDDQGNPQYRDAVKLVRDLVIDLPNYEHVEDLDAALAGRLDPANPDVFLAEVEEVSMPAAAVAAVMLVRLHPAVTTEVFRQVMLPWWHAHLGYRAGAVGYLWNSTEGRYLAKEIRGARPDPIRVKTPADLYEQDPTQPAPAEPDQVDVQLDDEPERRPPAAPVPPPAATRETPRDSTPGPVPEPVTPQRPAPGDLDLDDREEYGYSVKDVVHAVELVAESQFGSTPMLQRKLRLGFSATSSMIDRLEEYGIVGPREGTGPRRVLVKAEPEQIADAMAHVMQCEIEYRTQD